MKSDTNKIHILASIVAMAVPLLTATGCSNAQSECLPEPMSVSQPTVQPGAKITVSAPAAKCDLGYAQGKNYTLQLISEYAEEKTNITREVRVNTDGSFSDEVPIPEQFPQGAAMLLISGSPFDECDELNSCAAYAQSFRVTADEEEQEPSVLDHLDSLLFKP